MLGGSSMVRMSYERHESLRRARTSTCVARAPIHRSDRLGRIDGRRTALEEADRHTRRTVKLHEVLNPNQSAQSKIRSSNGKSSTRARHGQERSSTRREYLGRASKERKGGSRSEAWRITISARSGTNREEVIRCLIMAKIWRLHC